MPRRKLDRPNYKLRQPFKRKGNWSWYVTWSEDRKPRRISCRTNDKAEANEFLISFLAGLDIAPAPEDARMGAIFDGYLADRRATAVSWKRLEEACVPLRKFYGPLLPKQIKRAHTRRYAAERGVSVGTILKELRTLRAALNWAVREEWIDRAPYIEMPASPPPAERWLTKREAETLLSECRSPHMRLFMQIALHTAARKGAILDLTWDRVDLERGLIDFNPPGRAQTAKRRVSVPINNVLRAALTEALELAQSDYVIEYHGAQVGNVKKAFERAARRAGLNDVTPKTLRTTAATWMAQRGVPMRLISGVLGHTTEQVTARVYAKHHPDYLRDAVAALEA